MERVSRESLGEVLATFREVEHDGFVYRVGLPDVVAGAKVRKAALDLSNRYGEDAEDRDQDRGGALIAWARIVTQAVASTLVLDGEEAAVGDEGLAARLLARAGGDRGPLAQAAMEQCGLAIPPLGDAGGQGDAADGNPF